MRGGYDARTPGRGYGYEPPRKERFVPALGGMEPRLRGAHPDPLGQAGSFVPLKFIGPDAAADQGHLSHDL